MQTVPYGPIEQIPQVNITVAYEKEIINTTTTFPVAQTITEMDNRTAQFSDARYIRLKNQDPVLYVDEVNTEFLTENFDIEVFVVTGSNMERKYFETQTPQIVNNLMVRQSPGSGISPATIPRTAVEYYFDLRRDSQTDSDIVCKQMQVYNKSSYYIDVDLACPEDDIEKIYNDIYGSEVVPEICLD